MDLELQKPGITEIQVRMDCNGCVQKLKKALSGISGIYDVYMDLPDQKITIVGWADPERIMKAIKKTRKSATICSYVEPMESPSQPAEAEPQGNAELEPEPEPEPPLAQPEPPPPPPPPPEATIPTLNNTARTKDVEEVHGIYPYDPNYINRLGCGHSAVFLQEPPPSMYMTQSYNTYRPSPYVTEYEYVRSPSRHVEYYSGEYQNGNANITSIFSDENPNACKIV